MRTGLLAAALLLPAAAAAADPPDPPVVFQAHSVGQVLDTLRAAAEAVGGEGGAKAVNKWVKGLLGDKGFEGVDINRPVAGYVVLAPKPEGITVVVALPVTGEQEFLDLCERASGRKPRPDGAEHGPYHLSPPGARHKALLRFADGYAYLAYGADPAPHAGPKALVPVPKLYDPAERGVVAARVHFDRVPPAVKLAAPALLGEVKKTLFEGGPGFLFGIGGAEREFFGALGAGLEKLAARYAGLAAGADVFSARLAVDPRAGALVAEATLAPKPGTELAKVAAARKPTGNRFGALAAHPDTAFAFRTRLPLFEPEIRAGVAGGLGALGKAAAGEAPGAAKDLLGEVFGGLVRTVKTGEFDLAGGVRGPDANEHFTAVGAVAFEDTAKLEKEFKAFVQAEAPRDVQDGITWDAAKAGAVSVHAWKVPGAGVPARFKAFGGEACTVAFAFAPHGVLVAVGPDPVPAVKDAVAAKPADAPVLDLSANPARVRKFVRAIAPNEAEAARVEELFGKEDKLASVAALTVDGGKELTVRLTLDLRVLPRLVFSERAAPAGDGMPSIPAPDKN